MTESDAVRLANDAFYSALDGLDLARMDAVWLHDASVRCIHPGSDLLQGWNDIRASWGQIFAATSWIRVTPTNVDVRVIGDVALVVCTENIAAKHEDDVRVAVALATNLYRKTADGWRMIHHHASSAPVSVTQPFSGTIQ